mmetsp:Transcript_10328/g.10321  ORF Transcript_10328/g.10321 Transcript_10328/m.10321 type:complete len:89 (+) Transcript_10328:1435-1701(+)
MDQIKRKWRETIYANLDNILKQLFECDLQKTGLISYDKFKAILDKNEIHLNEEDVNNVLRDSQISGTRRQVNYFLFLGRLGFSVEHFL